MDGGAAEMQSSRPVLGAGLSERARVGLKYQGWAVALTAGLIMSIAMAGAALAADPTADVVADGVVTVTWIDSDDGPIAGASIKISYYHEGDQNRESLPAATTDADGAVVIPAVPRPAEGALPLLLDIRGEFATATVDDAGCTTLEGWQAESNGVAAALAVDVVLSSSTKSISVTCPEPTPTPEVVDPTPAPDPTATPGGAVLGATGRPQVTLPATDTVGGSAEPAGSPFMPVLLALVGLAVLIVPATSLAFARAQARPRPRPRSRR
jgi:hypothetical protein